MFHSSVTDIAASELRNISSFVPFFANIAARALLALLFPVEPASDRGRHGSRALPSRKALCLIGRSSWFFIGRILKSATARLFGAHKKRASISRRNAQRDRRSRRADARCRFGLVTFLDVNSAARAGHGDELLARVADEFAPSAAGRLVECVQTGHPCRAGWARRTRRPRRADAAACTVGAARAGWPRRPWQALPSCIPLRSRRSGRSWGPWRSGRPLFSFGT
jgi:hypothetical protein